MGYKWENKDGLVGGGRRTGNRMDEHDCKAKKGKASQFCGGFSFLCKVTARRVTLEPGRNSNAGFLSCLSGVRVAG